MLFESFGGAIKNRSHRLGGWYGLITELLVDFTDGECVLAAFCLVDMTLAFMITVGLIPGEDVGEDVLADLGCHREETVLGWCSSGEGAVGCHGCGRGGMKGGICV